MPPRTELLQGSLDLLILKSLTLGPLHGWGISRRIRDLSSDVLQVNQGSLYPALYRLVDRGWIDSETGLAESGRQTKLYRLTAVGAKQLRDERAQWRRFAAAMEAVLAAT